MQENIAFDPCIGAIEVENIIGSASEDVVVVLNYLLAELTVATGEIHDVVVAARRTEERITDNPASAAFDSPSAVQKLKGRRAGRKNATADEKRTVVQRHILMRRRPKTRMIEVDRSPGHFDARRAVAIEKSVSDSCLG